MIRLLVKEKSDSQCVLRSGTRVWAWLFQRASASSTHLPATPALPNLSSSTYAIMVQPLPMPMFAPDPAIPWHIYKRARFFSRGWSISASRVLTHFQASLEGEHSGEDDDLTVQLAEGEYLEIKRYLETGHDHVNDYHLMCVFTTFFVCSQLISNHRYDYVEHDRTISFRKPSELCQWIVDDFIATIKIKASERSGLSPNFAHFTDGLVQLRYMKVPIGKIGTYSPLGVIGPLTGPFLTVPLPTSIVEAFDSQSTMSPAKRAKDYLNGTNGRIRVVICITVDGGRQAGKEATFSVWRMERKNGVWTVVNSAETVSYTLDPS